MNGHVTVPLPARRKGWHGRARVADVAPGALGTASAPTPDRIPRVARVLALAHHWQGLIRSGAVRNQADLARLVGVSRARITQVLNLLRLAPEIQEAILTATRTAPTCGGIAERTLQAVAAIPTWADQSALWNQPGTARTMKEAAPLASTGASVASTGLAPR